MYTCMFYEILSYKLLQKLVSEYTFSKKMFSIKRYYFGQTFQLIHQFHIKIAFNCTVCFLILLQH